MSRNGIGFLNIQTCLLKVHMHCQGCQKKVKKLLRKIEGVHSVHINGEEQVVMVSGSVDSATLIKKLARSGKHAEVWSPSSSFIRDDQNRNNSSIDPSQQIFPIFLGNDVPDQQRHENYLNHNMGMEAVSGEIDQNLMGNAYVGDHENRLAMEDHMRPMMVHAAVPGNAADFVGFGRFQDIYARKPTDLYEHSPPPMMSYSHPWREMTQPVHNTMVNHNETHQPDIMDHNSSRIPPYKNAGFSSAPYTFY